MGEGSFFNYPFYCCIRDARIQFIYQLLVFKYIAITFFQNTNTFEFVFHIALCVYL